MARTATEQVVRTQQATLENKSKISIGLVFMVMIKTITYIVFFVYPHYFAIP